MALQYVKALYDFDTAETGEISLHVGDVVLLLYKVDDNWICGKLRGQIGNFPSAFVQPVVIPHAEPGQRIFTAVQDFPSTMSGDLEMQKGDIVLVLKSIDKNWWHGQNGQLFGMFPATHVRELDTAPSSEYVSYSPELSSTESAGYNTASQSVTESITNGGHSNVYIAKAVANMDLCAQLSDELGFLKGDVVNVIKCVDSDFAYGECNGNIGSFPLSFVELIEGDLGQQASESKQEKRRSKFKWWEEESSSSSNTQETTHSVDYKVQPAVDQTTYSTTDQSFLTNDHSSFSTTYSDYQEPPKPLYLNDQPPDNNINTHLQSSEIKTHRRNGSYTQENTRSYDTSLTAYGKTVFPFVAENPNELTFFDNEIVNLIQHVDEHWILGEIDGKQGIFPTSYVDIIVDCPWPEESQLTRTNSVEQTENNELSESVEQTSSMEQVVENSEQNDNYRIKEEISDVNISQTNEPCNDNRNNQHQNNFIMKSQSFSEQCYARVLYDYKPENPEDLCVLEGDTVTILRQADEHWYEVQHDNGQHGYCPINYVEVITSEPNVEDNTCESQIEKEIIEDDNKPVDDNKLAQETNSVNNNENKTETVLIKPVISAKPKPLIKPKPALKPKPGALKSGSAGVPKSQDQKSSVSSMSQISMDEQNSPINKSSTFVPLDNSADKSPTFTLDDPTSQENGISKSTVMQEDKSEKDNKSSGNTNNVLVQPKRPPIPPTQRMSNVPPKKPAGPVFVKTNSFTMDSNLDDIIKDQMKIATEEAEVRSRSSSALSDSSNTSTSSQPAIPPRRVDSTRNYEPLRELQNTSSTNNKLRTSVQLEKKVAFSTFYSSESDPSFSQNISGNSSTVRPRPVPSRPAMPPPRSNLTSPPRGKSPAQRSATIQGRPTKITLSSKTRSSSLIPQRPAPPRPATHRNANADLMMFSPNGEQLPPIGDQAASAEDAENEQVIADLDKRIQEIEDDIQAYTKNKQELERFLVKHQNGSSSDEVNKVQENLDFTVANIVGLTEELNQRRESLYQFKPERREIDLEVQRQAESQRVLVEAQKQREDEEKKHKEEAVKKRKETRERVIDELIQTERDYLGSISVCHHAFLSEGAVKHPQVDLVTLFGNLEEVIELSQRLLSSLEEATQGKEFEEQKMGECFVHLKKDITRVYAPYCRNHDDVITLLETYEKNPEIQEFFIQLVEQMKEQITVFDIGSLLIKPVQRVLKYPLLLNELIKNTEEDHPDKFHLLGAITCMMQVAAAINESKRRKDLVRKYKVEKKEDLGDKLARLNVHSTKKKLSRFSTKLVGVQTIDENFNREEKKFKSLESSVRVLVKNISQYMEQVQLSVFSLESLANDISDYYGDKRHIEQVQQYCTVANHMATKHFYKFKQQVEVPVIHPLNRLVILYQAPIKVIKKRYDKLLDYDNLASKGQGDAQLSKNVEMAKNNYAALNAQLLDELPQLFELSLEVIRDCLTRYVDAQKAFYGSCLEEMYTLLGLQLVLEPTEQALLDSFNVSHMQVVEKLSDLSFVTKSFNPRLEDKKVGVKGRRSSELKSTTDSSSSQSESQKQQLIQKYAPVNKLFMVNLDHTATQMMDLTVSRGCMVGVLKEGDPMGNKGRWYVDDGSEKGFIPSKLLTPYSPSKSLSVSSSNRHSTCSVTSVSATGDVDLLSMEDIVDAQPPVSPASPWNPSETLDPFTPVFEQPLTPTPVHQSSIVSQSNTAYFSQSSTFLEPSSLMNQPQSPIHSIHPSQSVISSETDGSSAKAPSVTRSDTFDELDHAEYYQAIYPFQARTELEITLTEGQYVNVIEKHDLEGNEEWWLVESHGQKGYAPANYIYEVQ